MRRHTVITLLVGSVFVASCTSSSSISVPKSSVPTSPVPLLTFHDGGISFRYPGAWTAYRYSFAPPSSFSSVIVYLSNDPLHPPCDTHGNETSCGDPIDSLAPGGLLVTWSASGFPGWNFQKAKGTPITIGGHRAKIQFEQPGTCRRIGGDESISVTVEQPAAPDNSWGISACIRGPNVSMAEEQVREMLRTAQFP